MGTITPINPRVVFVSATIPSDLTEGKLWYNTTNNSLYTSNGSSYVLLAEDLSFIQKQQLAQDVNILINSAGASTTLNDYDDMFLDIFSDADGLSDTIDTTNTTASFSISSYLNQSIITETAPVSSSSQGSKTGYAGMKILVGDSDVICNSITETSGSNAPTGVILDSSKNVVATAPFISHTATFSTPYTLTANTVYYLSQSGSGYTGTYTIGTGYPVAGTLLSWTGGLNSSADNTDFYSILSTNITSGVSNKIIQTNAQTITANPIGHQVFSNNTTAGTGTITYNISFDDGTTWITDQALNTKNTSVHDGTEMVIKLNLNGVGAGNTTEASNYAIMLFY